MFKKENPPVKMNKSQASDLALLISRIQKNADKVEKNVLHVEDMIAVDSENKKTNQPFCFQRGCTDKLKESEDLLKDLFLNIDMAKKLGHPQANEIELDVNNLHDRWVKDCAFYRELYENKQQVDTAGRSDWAQVLTEKQRQVDAQTPYGRNLSELEKQIAAHNILNKEIESYGAQLNANTSMSPEKLSALQKQYTTLVESSKLRQKHLKSLYDYIQSCSKELIYLSEQEEKILKRDWSDRMSDPAGVRREYEKFKTSGLLSHEKEAAQLEDEGDRLISMKHPGSATIEAHRDALQNEWQDFLNLCVCQETHLDNVEDYKKYQLEVDTLSDSLKKLNSTLDPKGLENKSNSEMAMQLEGDDRTIERSEKLLAELKKLSASIAPLPLRRTRSTKPTTVVSLCDWTAGEDSVSRGEKLTLKSNSDPLNWEVQTSTGKTKTLPGVCFLVPPPDSEAMERVDRLQRELSDLKRKRASLQSSVKGSGVEVARVQKAAPVANTNASVSAKEDPKANALADRLDQINQELEKREREVLARLRNPLDRNDPTQDLAKRLKDQERTVQALKTLEAEKSAVQREMEPILSAKPLGPTASALPNKLSDINNKFENIFRLSDLYTKKANASMNLEGQIKKVGDSVSGFEKQLAKDTAIPDAPNAIQTCSQELQDIRKAVDQQKDKVQKLSGDLELSEQLSSSLQRGFQEYCPDSQRQEADVKWLKNRYANVNNQLQNRTMLMQEAANKNQAFQTSVNSLDSYLKNLPNNRIYPNDDLAQINSKENSQKRVVEDLKRKSADVNLMMEHSRGLQSVLNDYEANSVKYISTLDNMGPTDAKRFQFSNLADGIQKKEKALLKAYSEASVENTQLLSQMGLAKNLISKNNEKVNLVVEKQQMQMQSQQRDLVETDGFKKELADEIARRQHVENDLEVFRKRMISLKSRRGVERFQEKEVVQYYRDPKLESDLITLRDRIHDEALKQSSTKTEVEVLNQKIIRFESELTSVQPKLVNKVFTEYERDPKLDAEATRLKEEMLRLREEVEVKHTETVQMKTEFNLLQQKRPTIKEKVVKKEVLKLEKDPEMLKAVQTFEIEIANEGLKCKSLNDEIFSTRSQINTLERIIPTIQPKVIVKELKKVEQDPNLINDSNTLRSSLEDERKENMDLMKVLTNLTLQYSQVEKLRNKVEMKEIINETFRVDPDTEKELLRLKKELQISSRQCTDIEKEINTVTIELNSLRSQPPKVELKEVTQEVVKQEKSPEVIREMQRLNEQLSRLQTIYDTTWEQLTRFRSERDELKIERSKVETKLVNKEVVKYENDPLLEKEADRLRRNVREEIQNRRNIEEMVFDLQNKYILLERQKPEEKILMQEVVRLQKDPMQILEHEKLNKTLDEEVKARRKLEIEVRQLRSLVEEKERTLSQMDDRQKKIQVETELRRLKSRILELENTPPSIEEKIVIEEVLRVEKDPKLDILTKGLNVNLDNESSTISRLQRDIQKLRMTLEILQKDKLMERTVYKEVIRVEKDEALETERSRLTELVLQEKNARRDKEDEIQKLTTRLNRLQTTRSSTSQEETVLTSNQETLLRERENLTRDLNMLIAEKQNITISFQQQTRLISERSQMSKQRTIKLESDIELLEKDILAEKDRINRRETTIMELMNRVKKEDTIDTQTRATNLSTKITILDPETGKDMSPYDAFVEGLIDRDQYIHLQKLECNWEEISTMGPEGEITMLRDQKSGKQFSIKDAVRDGRLSQYDLQRYKDGKMHISEFALLVAGETKPKPYISSKAAPRSPVQSNASSSSFMQSSTSSLMQSSTSSSMQSSTSSLMQSSTQSTLRSSNTNLSTLGTTSGDDNFPISGVMDTTTNSRMSVRSALTRKLIDSNTAQKLLEAQAATGGIVDITLKDRFSVHKAAERGLIDRSALPQLINAQKAFTGFEDPATKGRLSVGQAAKKGMVPMDSAMRYMEAQFLTGGLVNPNKAGRTSVQDAVQAQLIDSAVAKDLQDESLHSIELIDPITKEKMTYKQAMARCKRDTSTGLLLFPAASTDSVDAPSYSSYRFSSSHSRV